MPLPPPAFSCSIPSVHDDTTLSCRLYHPASFGDGAGEAWRRRGAVVAHPYAPLGGSQDDPVVAAVATELLGKGYVVGTFNFRGAGNSKGRTSWTAKAELADYVSFAGFFVHYLQHLQPPGPDAVTPGRRKFSEPTLSPIPSSVPVTTEFSHGHDARERGNLILAGYSYGAMLTTYLPPTRDVLDRFSRTAGGSAEAEIRLRALALARQWNEDEQHKRAGCRGRSSQRKGDGAGQGQSHAPVVVGGEESEPGTRQASHEARRSMESLRRSFDLSRKSLTRRRSADKRSSDESPPATATDEVAEPRTSYLLISPLLGPVSSLATLFSSPAVGRASRVKLTMQPCLAVFGDRDMFTSPKRLRKWAAELAAARDSLFHTREIAGAGHFWHEEGVEGRLREAVGVFAADVLA
ncbi:MAG: hypothetical protein M1832_000855 [Thelocarpon impressellum]|nr:MAG: hypothetical protein M1832_000855 [Thelocarpon impressellum]